MINFKLKELRSQLNLIKLGGSWDFSLHEKLWCLLEFTNFCVPAEPNKFLDIVEKYGEWIRLHEYNNPSLLWRVKINICLRKQNPRDALRNLWLENSSFDLDDLRTILNLLYGVPEKNYNDFIGNLSVFSKRSFVPYLLRTDKIYTYPSLREFVEQHTRVSLQDVQTIFVEANFVPNSLVLTTGEAFIFISDKNAISPLDAAKIIHELAHTAQLKAALMAQKNILSISVWERELFAVNLEYLFIKSLQSEALLNAWQAQFVALVEHSCLPYLEYVYPIALFTGVRNEP